MTEVQMHPFELLSWEGVFGTLFMVIALLVLNVMPGARRPSAAVHMTTPLDGLSTELRRVVGVHSSAELLAAYAFADPKFQQLSSVLSSSVSVHASAETQEDCPQGYCVAHGAGCRVAICGGALAGSDVGGKMENLADTFAMLRNSRTVLGMDLVVVLCVLAANIGGANSQTCMACWVPLQHRKGTLGPFATSAWQTLAAACLVTMSLHPLPNDSRRCKPCV